VCIVSTRSLCSLIQSVSQEDVRESGEQGFRTLTDNSGRTVRVDIRLDIRKITEILVELSVQPRISVVHRAPISVAPISARISGIGFKNIRARSLR